ncbi:YadA-like family protein [Burkholderia pseudomultivorans]|uniref:Adhesin n=1 Tax=Burkholderia pseudomultivorans TaxID=1207504 RepID=A0A132E6W5_9BURK|nr:YadA-like family protein [Burkholderia pseudomultivorans]KWF17329.1 hypothetical protein WT56_33185 [Burkholderia pseudomultivorans]
MNKTYRTVWNATTGTWTAAAETARTRTKSKSNTAMRSSVTAAVAVMAGVGGGAMSADANAQAANGGGSLALCAPSGSSYYGTTFGGGNTAGTRMTGACGAIPGFRLSEGHVTSFQLYNNSNVNGGGVGQASAATEAGISGTVDGHLFVLGGSGVHLRGPVDVDSNFNMTSHRITNLAAGTAGTDAVNLNQLNSAIAAAAATSNPYVVTNTGTYAAATAARAGGSATAVGANANAGGTSAVALGGNTVATGQNAVALGTLANATGDETVAVGVSARAAGNNATAMGRSAAAASTNTTSVGYGSYAGADGATALGMSASAVGSNAIAVGRGASTSGTWGSAIGYFAQGTTNAVAIGVLANAASASSVALGERSSATGATATALGRGAMASGSNTVALGANSIADRNNVVSVGSAAQQRQIVNVAAGTQGTDAVNLNQLNTAIANVSSSVNPAFAYAVSAGVAASATTAGDVAVGQEALASSPFAGGGDHAATAVGWGARAVGERTTALGMRASASANDAIALGYRASATTDGSVALGQGSVADRGNAVSVGSDTTKRQIINVAAGTQDTDAVNVSQLKDSGLIGDDGKSIAAVTYDRNADGTPNYGTVTLGNGAGPTQIKNVADATDDHDALNLGQLKDTGLVGDDGAGKLTSLAVTYDGTTKDSVTLGGAGATTPVALHNVADGVLSATSKDAVNGSQLFATNQELGNLKDSLKDGGVIDPMTGESLAVVYDGAAKDSVTLKGADGTTLSNVKAGVADMDAVNVSQLKGSGLIGDDGKSIAAVTYDRHADGTPNYGSVTLGNGTGPTQLKNVADATDDGDALNLGQLKNAGLVGEDTSGKLTSLAVTYDGASKDSVTLGGAGATTPVALKNVADGVDRHDAINLGQLQDAGLVAPVDPTNPGAGLTSLAVTYDGTAKDKVTLAGTDGTTLSNVKAGVADMDAVNVSQLKGSGLIGDDGKSIAAVTYDRHADGTPNYGSVTLGNGTGPTQIKNVADATDDSDALNLGQLKNAGLVGDDGSGKLTSMAVVYDGAARDKVTLAGTDGTTLSNVKAGVADTDAVNVSQLKGSGLIGDDGKSIAAVTYDRHTDGTPNYGSVTLGGAGAATPVALKNVATGVDGTDAVNVNQLNTGLSDLEDRLSGADLRFVKVNADPVSGTPAIASGALAVAIGAGAQGAGANSLALGSGTRVTGNGSVAIGYNSVANQNNVVSVGAVGQERRIVNVADGDVAFQSTDAINGGQLYAALNNLSTSVTSKTQQAIDSFSSEIDKKTKAAIDEVNSRSMQPMDVTDPLVAIEGLQGNNLASLNGADPATSTAAAIGTSSVASGGNAVAVGLQSIAGSNNSVAIGSFAGTGAGQDYSVAVGSNVQTNGMQAVALGANTQANGDYALAIGNNGAQAIGDSSIALGNAANVRAGATNAIAIGTGANIARSVEGAMALGANATAAAANSIALGADSFSNRANALSVGRAGAERQIVNVAAGTQATDAVNVSQLTGLANALGGHAAVGVDGSITQPTYNVDGSDYHNVGDALDALASRSAGDPNAVAYDSAAKDTVTLGGAGATTPVALKNVADAKDDHDALNLGQLKNAGLVGDDGTGNLTSLAVTYDGAAKDSVTLGGAGATAPVALKNVADGVDRHDAINLGQLQDAGLVAPVDPTNPGAGLTSLAVTYDGVAKDTVTLAGTGGTTLSNVKAGVADMDAVNVSQLKDAGLIGDDGKSIAAVTYDRHADGTPNYGSVTLGNGTGPTQIKNVADATDDGDALNLGQLKNAGLVGDDGSGKLTSLAVTYDGASKDSVTLGGAGATTPVALKNVADGVDRHDAINLGQLQDAGLVAPVDPTNPGAGLTSLAVAYDDASKDVVTLKGADGTTLTNVKAGAVTATSTDAINGSQLHATAQSVADSLGGGSTVDADGKVTNPSYSLADPADASKSKSYNNVGDALANLDGRTSTNTENITVINKQLADSGLVDPATGQSIAAVTYDRNADGTPNLGSVTLGGAGATAPVALKNVADGVDRHDAINVGQLQTAGLVAPVDPTNPGAGLTSLAVTYDKHADGSANFDQITLKGANGSTLTNVKAGAVNATSMDAVNGSQLYGASKSTADALGGGATVDANGNVTNPTYTVNNKTYNNVGDAIENISNSLVHGSIGLVQQDEDTREITVAKDTDGTTVNFTGTAGDRVLTGVGAGAVSATSNDAINGSQLHGTAQSVADVIGGGTTVDADGKLADTSIEVNGSKYKTVAEAVQAAAAYGATDSLAVRYDLNADGTPNYGSVTLGGTGAAPVRLTNVADGVNQYDAVNYGQLSELSDRIGGLDDRVGALEQNPGTGNPNPGDGGSGNDYFAGTDIGSTGTTPANAGDGTGNTAAGSNATIATGVSNATVIGSGAGASKDGGVAIGSNAASAAEGAVAIGRGSDASGSQSTAIGDGAKASGSNSVAVGAGSVATEANTVSFGNGTDDGNRRLTNIKDGINESDAATKGQLDRAVGGMQGQINDLSRNAYSGIAAATALTMIPGVDPGKTLSFGVGGATYRGYQAVAFGGEARITQNLKMKAGVGLSSGGNTVGVGASYQW